MMNAIGLLRAVLAFAVLGADAFVITPSFTTSRSAAGIVSPRASYCKTALRTAPIRLRVKEAGSGAIGLRSMADYTMEKVADLDGGAVRFKFSVQVPADLTRSSYATIMKDFKKNAKFPGFRVGTIPAFMIPKVKSFVILECLERTLKEAVDTEGLELADAEKKPTLDDAQVERLTKDFKETDGFSYTIEGEFKAKVVAPAS